MKSKKPFYGARWFLKGIFYSRKPPKVRENILTEIGVHPKRCKCGLRMIFGNHDGRALSLSERTVFCLRVDIVNDKP